MSFFGDHAFVSIVIVIAITLYGLEMFFFWFKWHSLSERLSTDQVLVPSIQELQGELEVLAGEVALLRREGIAKQHVSDLMIDPDIGTDSFFAYVPPFKQESFAKRVEQNVPAFMPRNGVKDVAVSNDHPLPNPLQSHIGQLGKKEESDFFSTKSAESSFKDIKAKVESVHSSHEISGQTRQFSRGVEVLHRRVVELARNGIDSATIAGECQLSQTETELILSLNGIRRSA